MGLFAGGTEWADKHQEPSAEETWVRALGGWRWAEGGQLPQEQVAQHSGPAEACPMQGSGTPGSL